MPVNRAWRNLVRNLGAGLVSQLIGCSKEELIDFIDDKIVSIKPFASRLDYLAELYRYLSGGYTPKGIVKWFSRNRVLLNNLTPMEILTGDWHPKDNGPQAVLVLAKSLCSSSSA